MIFFNLDLKKIVIVIVILVGAYIVYTQVTGGLEKLSTDELFVEYQKGDSLRKEAVRKEILARAERRELDWKKTLRKLKNHDKEDVRVLAAEALGETALKEDEIVKGLIEALSDESDKVKIKATEAFQKIRVKEAVRPLIDLLSNSNKELKSSAMDSLMKITQNQKLKRKYNPGAWTGWWNRVEKDFVVPE